MENKIEYFFTKIGTILVCLARGSVRINANCVCSGWFFEPKQPKDLPKLKNKSY